MGIIGEEWIVVRPETTGFITKLKSSLLGGGGLTGVGNLVGASAVAGIGVGLFAIGEKFQSTYNKIKVQTGATGKTFEALKGDVKSVLGDTAGSFDQVGAAISGIFARTGLTGKALDDLAKRQVVLARITKTDVGTNVDTTTKLFAKYGIAAKDQGKELDVLFRASQKAGTGIGDIISPMLRGGAALQQFGFGIDKSAALIASLTKAGVNVQPALMSLRSAFGKIVKEGGDPVKVLRNMELALRSGKDPAKAMAGAMALLGNRGGLELANAIKSGKFNLDDMLKSITGSSGGILQTGNEVSTLGGKFQILKNKVLVALEPIATKLVDLANHYLRNIINYVDRMGGLGGVFEKWKGPILAVVAALALWFAPIEAVIAGLVILYMKNETFRNIVNGVVQVIQTKFVPALQAIGQWIMTSALPALQQFAGFLSGTVWPIIQQVVSVIVGKFQELAAATSSRWADIQTAISNVLTAIKVIVAVTLAPIFIAWKLFHNQIMAVVNTIWTLIKAVIQNALQIIQGIIDIVLGVLSGHWGRAWNGIKEVVGGVWNLIVAIVKAAIGLVWQAIQAGLVLAGTVAKKGLDALIGFFGGLGTKIIDAFKGAGSWLKDVGKQIVQGLIDGINSMLSQLATAVFNLQSKIPGSSFFSKLPGGSKFGHAAMGSSARAGQPFIVGELGPELFVPSGSGTIVPHNKLTGSHSGVGGTSVTLILAPTFPPGMDAATAMAHMQAFTVETIAKTFEDVAAGGRVRTGTNR